MFPFFRFWPFDRTECKALLFAALFSCLGIFVFSFARPHEQRTTISIDTSKLPTPVAPNQSPGLPRVDVLHRFRVTPARFERIDFANHSYGPYSSSDGTTINLKLEHSQLRLPNSSGWFVLKDVYFKDVTGDDIEDAVVWLTHVQCSDGSCNAGTHLFYIYTMRNGMLKPIWQYETASYEHGCGLRSFTVSYKQIMLALFGDCTKSPTDDAGPANYLADGFTFVSLKFNGGRFTQKSTDFFATRPTNVHSYDPAINIY